MPYRKIDVTANVIIRFARPNKMTQNNKYSHLSHYQMPDYSGRMSLFQKA